MAQNDRIFQHVAELFEMYKTLNTSWDAAATLTLAHITEEFGGRQIEWPGSPDEDC